MKNEICVLSTKKLASHQKQFLLNADFSVIEADFIKIKPLAFQLKTQPSLLLFTSQNGVKSVLANEAAEQLKSIPAVCVGSKTRKLLEDNGFQVLATKEYAEELAPIIQENFTDKHVSFFAGDIRSIVLPVAMHEKNIPFDEYTVYTNQENPVEIQTKTNALLFFSPSGIRSFLKKNNISNEICFCIGTTTADALKGITENIVIANQQTVENVIIQCINYYK